MMLKRRREKSEKDYERWVGERLGFRSGRDGFGRWMMWR